MPSTTPTLLLLVLVPLGACTHPLRPLHADGGGTLPADAAGGSTAWDGRTSDDRTVTGTGGRHETGGVVDGTTGFGGAVTGGRSTTNRGGTMGSGGRASSGGTAGGGGASGGTTSPGGSSGKGGTMSGGTAGGSSGCPSNPDMISDFEASPGKATLNSQPNRTGYWYVFFPGSDTSAKPRDNEAISPALDDANPITTEAAPDRNACNQFALHSTGKGFTERGDRTPEGLCGVGFGALFSPRPRRAEGGYPYRAENYSGISFKMKSGSGTPPAVFFEVLTEQSMPISAGGTASDKAVDLYNTRGQLLNAPWASSNITPTYQTFTVPFGTMVPRWLPSPNGASYEWPSHGACGLTQVKCQAAPFVASDVLGIRISMYPDPGFPTPADSTLGTYDLWIDDVAFVKNDAGLPTRKGFPLTSPGSFGKCKMPSGPSTNAKFLVPAYDHWKTRFVRNNKVIRTENGDDVVSEGIAFGMLIALNMNDQPLFDGLYGTWKGNPAAGAKILMKSCLGGTRGYITECSPSDSSSTGADQDVVYALLMADKLWGGTYKADAVSMLKEIWDKDIDGADSKLPKGGSGYKAPTGTDSDQITSASYFAPSYYRAFASVDPDSSHDWLGVVAAVYKAINGPVAGSNGLIPAWCGKSCTVAASEDGSGRGYYQYDSHRIPMRIALDYCFNGAVEAKAYTDRTTAFFASVGRNGMGYIMDMYNPQGGPAGQPTTNSASILGTAAAGAMASGTNSTFLNDAYQLVFDVATRGTMAPALIPPFQSVDRRQPTYGYYNATMAMLTLLIMTGNFMH